jgi:hypothetical protein
VNTLFALALLVAAGNLPPVQTAKPLNASATQPVFVNTPKGDNGLTLYDPKGEVIARCDKKGEDTFGNCKLEPGVSLDDLMNAWVHAYQDIQK